MKRYLALYHEWVGNSPKRRFINIYARDKDQALAKWTAMRTSNEDLVSLKYNPSPEQFWQDHPQLG